MKRAGRTSGLLVLFCALAFSQDAPKTSEFEAADVHVSAAGTTESGWFLPDGRMEFRATTLLRFISLAYSVRDDRVSGGPSWIDTDRFDVIAKAPTAASPAAMRTMLQSLLAERFQLSVRKEEKQQPVYALVPGKRASLKESSGGDPVCKRGAAEGVMTYDCHHTSIASLAQSLPSIAPAYFDLPVVDRTGMKGFYDFRLQWMGRGQLPPGSEGASFHLYRSIENELGLKVEKQTEPAMVLTVERVNRTPSANPQGVTEKLGPAPTEFEVATIKRSRSDEQRYGNVENGRVDARGFSIKDFIGFAYNVDYDRIVGGEKWLESERFDILAKSVPTASTDTLRGMMQSLMAERFRLKIHKDQQPVQVYALTAPGKHKLNPADPSTRSACKVSVQDGARVFTCQNTTMAQFAEKLRGVAPAYLDHVVVDLTELTGAYDFAVSYTQRVLISGGKQAAPAGGEAAPAAADRPAGLTIFEAVERQLGLKLAARKHPMPVIVIDHVERTPTEN